jgi:ribosomal-protein-alanine N-acetyltransferase
MTTDRQSDVRLRAYRSEDFPILYEIDQACFPPGVSYSRGELARFLAQRDCRAWIAEAGGRIVGFLIVERGGPTYAHIITIDVRAEWRCRGVGRTLMDAAEEWARDQRLAVMYLETAEDNLAAQQFYESRGYTKVDHINGYYANGRAAWLMVKNLTAAERIARSKQQLTTDK